MRVDLFDFELPESAIALRPAEPRDAARMLEVRSGGRLTDRHVRDLPGLLNDSDVLVVNDTKVMPAELHGERERGAHVTPVSVTLFERLDSATWKAFARPARRFAAGDRVRFAGNDGTLLEANVEGREDAGIVVLRFDRAGAELDAAIHAIGHMPLPPYIAGKRPEDDRDREDYQTVYARHEGAVAAPTAGLHFTEGLMRELDAQGTAIYRVTLHVGPGTFLPVKVEDTDNHVMHAEWGEVSEDTAAALNRARAEGGRIISVGTTSLRLLESAAGDDGAIHPFHGETSIFITPGYRFRAVDLLMTNFHLPRSTLFMLVSAFSGREAMLAAYDHAIRTGYRFYSYGDTSLLHREDPA